MQRTMEVGKIMLVWIKSQYVLSICSENLL